ncbi:hypothetical protein MNBD_GAMMA12-1411 [hydrothermal vent metagenome]|uniref:Carbohydrate kinase PfkB domain-containing protein n=1 Tax=hydrothermal vent metagenome TaxID=652676 RepID=A0A3B0Y7F0_9ZZZZ
MHRVLAVGIATVDIISIVNRYPAANDKIRATQRYIQRGGNACNTLVVLAQLGFECTWFGTLAKDYFLDTVLNDLERYNINHSPVVYFQEASNPLSCITVDSSKGSRSIVHYRDLPELDYEQFKVLDWSNYDWIHFEGRNIAQTILMLELIASSGSRPKVSIEIEKNHPHIAACIPYADVIMFSQTYVMSQHYDSPSQFLKAHFLPDQHTALLCAWGDKGAWGMDHTGSYHSPAVCIDKVIDTTGAGDVFNAGIINGLLSNKSLADGLTQACILASKKCARQNFDLDL